MRAVILFNPKIQAEHYVKGREFAEASIGFEYNGDIEDHKAIASHLRELADMLTSPEAADPENL